jgi:hypothetical protein
VCCSSCPCCLTSVHAYSDSRIETFMLSPCSEEVDAMSVKELRAFLGSRGVSTTGFLEKSEFVAAARQALQR